MTDLVATGRDVLAEALRAHWRMAGSAGDWCGGCKRVIAGRWDDHVADALLASGAVRAADTLADDGARDVEALMDLLDLMRNFPSNEQRARYLLSCNWMLDRGAKVRAEGRADGYEDGYRDGWDDYRDKRA